MREKDNNPYTVTNSNLKIEIPHRAMVRDFCWGLVVFARNGQCSEHDRALRAQFPYRGRQGIPGAIPDKRWTPRELASVSDHMCPAVLPGFGMRSFAHNERRVQRGPPFCESCDVPVGVYLPVDISS